jgi:aminoglycoside phosphotransferase (APT) family kinase protein
MKAVPGADGLSLDDLVRLARSKLGLVQAVREIERRSNDLSTKLASEFITLHLDDGTALPLLVKKVIDRSQERRPQPLDSERRIYEDLGRHPAFAAPRYLGTIGETDPWLVLAAVDGWDLRYQGLDRWELAARALGRMHRSFHQDLATLRALNHLSVFDHDHCRVEAQTGYEVATRSHPQVDSHLRAVIADYGDIAAEVGTQPATLVHGDLAPKNILIEGPPGAEVTLFIDWEWACIGLGAIDLVDLVNGLETEAAQRLTEAYVDETRGTALPEGDAAIGRALDLAHLQRTMFRLGRSADWNVSAEQVVEWATVAAELHVRL